jgi:hypothetical protein
MKARTHKWRKNDAIITLFYHKYGIKDLFVSDETELAEKIICSSLTSLKMQSLNIQELIGIKKGLSHFSKTQKIVVGKYNKKSYNDLLYIVNNTILNRFTNMNKENYTNYKKELKLMKSKKKVKL